MAQIEVTGNVGKDAELKFISGSKGDFAIAKFSLAETPREYKNGEWVNGETVWWNISVTGKQAEQVVEVATKGAKLLIKGDLRQYSYEKDGETKSGQEIRAKIVAILPSYKDVVTNKQEDAWPF